MNKEIYNELKSLATKQGVELSIRNKSMPLMTVEEYEVSKGRLFFVHLINRNAATEAAINKLVTINFWCESKNIESFKIEKNTWFKRMFTGSFFKVEGDSRSGNLFIKTYLSDNYWGVFKEVTVEHNEGGVKFKIKTHYEDGLVSLFGLFENLIGSKAKIRDK